ncbi:MAG TPA: hypothetical protein VLY24_00110 [Bryobacteraceae bacterium]|nr:hypothetical protein [Bryobacteraceae bacterium]
MNDFVKVSPSQFYEAFLTVTSELAPSVKDLWFRNRQFTDLMRSSVFPKIAEHLGLCCYRRDYYTLDAIFYAETDQKHFPGATYAKFISVALEHEHDSSTTATEINKLQLFNAPLKVLITYPGNDREAKKLLGDYAEMIEEADAFEDFATSRRQLVIFGFLEEVPRWRAFVYSGASFTEIEVPILVAQQGR